MSCPSFGDLGKEAKDVYRSGFHLGLVNFSITSILKNINIGGNLKHNLDENLSSGVGFIGFESENFGKTIGKYTNGGVFSLQYFLKKNLFENVDINGIFSYNTESSESSLQVNSNYTTDNFHGNLSLTNCFELNSRATVDVVYRIKDIFVGYQTGFDTASNKFTRNDLGLGFAVNDMGFHFRCNSIPTEFGLSVHRKVANNWDVAMNGIFAKKGDSQFWTLGIGAKYELSDGAIFRCKVDKDQQIGISFCQRLLDMLNFTVSCNIDGANLDSGGHKAGISIELEA
ncbi:voltage-dependent anion-selective channel protein 2-like [Leptopilina boulardi]|uniref:voltage-dependent anion-selective channel protein 2-like n=1 Tax=Leptopilina boulardi TaxID=63433 RepID=UPI0021F66748|nr:voltage-dependent anion-selective channel protein 2-like [Leptopilina boulardi]